MAVMLTEGCIEDIFQKKRVENPVVQLLNHEIVLTNSGDKYQVIISDGKWYNGCVLLDPRLNELMANRELPNFSIVELNYYVVSQLARRKFIVICALTVLQNGNSVGKKLEDPQIYDPPEDDSLQIQRNFTPLSALKDLQPDSYVDVIGICMRAGNVQNLVHRTFKWKLKKLEVTLVDQTNTSVTLMLWNTLAEEFDGSMIPVVAVNAARVVKFCGGISVCYMSGSSTIQLNPDIEKSHQLRGWFDSLDDNPQFSHISKSGGDESGGQLGWSDSMDDYHRLSYITESIDRMSL